MNELIELRSNEAVTDSLKVAESFGKRHDRVLRTIDSLLSDLPKNGVVNFKKSTYRDAKGEARKMYYMNRDGFSLLVMGFTGKQALEWKLKYIEAFNKMEKILSEKATKAWLETRQQSKLTRKAETDAIQKFIEYAKEQGSKHADRYYIIFSKLANKTANITDRDMATTFQLNSLTFIESIIINVIECQLQLGTEYHEIYKRCVRAIDEFKDLTGYERLALA